MCIRGGNFALVEAENVILQGISGALVKCYGEMGELKSGNVAGVERIFDITDEHFSSEPT